MSELVRLRFGAIAAIEHDIAAIVMAHVVRARLTLLAQVNFASMKCVVALALAFTAQATESARPRQCTGLAVAAAAAVAYVL